MNEKVAGSKEAYEGYLEDVFDRVTVYFPINFSPPKNDKFQIQPETLRGKLKQCLLAGPVGYLTKTHFLPFLSEKMSQAA